MKAGVDHVVCKHDGWNAEGITPLLIHITELLRRVKEKREMLGEWLGF
jgi:hypothetical protein